MKRIVLATMTIAAFLWAFAGICAELAASRSIKVNASTEEVWGLLIAVDHWAEWNPAVKKSELKKGDGREPGSVVEFTPIIGGKRAPEVKLKLERSDKPNTYEFTSKTPGMNIVFGFSIVEKDGVTAVTSYETITGPGTAAFKALYGQEGLDQEHREWVEAVKNKLESTDEKDRDSK